MKPSGKVKADSVHSPDRLTPSDIESLREDRRHFHQWAKGRFLHLRPNSMMPTLEKAIEIAARAHAGHRDKAGQPYILHPLRVMLGVHSETARIAAVLHDVVEDTATTMADLRKEGFSGDVLAVVNALTHRKQESEAYAAYLARVKSNPTAIEIKLCDLRDNLDPGRLACVTAADEQRCKKYRNAWQFLTGNIWPA